MPRRSDHRRVVTTQRGSAAAHAPDHRGAACDRRPNSLQTSLAAAEQAARHPRLPTTDRTDIPFVTIDPEGSRDLDQALHIERRNRGFRVHYAIADVAAFVEPDGPIDVEAHRRGQTLYAPDHRVPLHPPVLSEGAASLLPDQMRPALVWSIDLDESGEGTRVDVGRARVRSRAQLRLPDGPATDRRRLGRRAAPATPRRSGLLRLRREAERGGVSLPLPEQEVVVDDGRWRLEYRALLPVEEWNAQISLLTGMGAAEIMLYGDVGLVRTLPAPSHDSCRAPSPYCCRAQPALGRRDGLPGLRPLDRPDDSGRSGHAQRVHVAACVVPDTSPSTAECPSTSSTPRWPTTPT